MKEPIKIHFTIPLDPITKKNSQQIDYKWIKDKQTGQPKNVPYIKPSEAYIKYANDAGWFINRGLSNLSLDSPLQITCIYYLSTRRQADLTNLLEATDDVLVKYNVIADDNHKIICSHDGSRVFYDATNPRTEIYITNYEATSYPLPTDNHACPCCGREFKNNKRKVF